MGCGVPLRKRQKWRRTKVGDHSSLGLGFSAVVGIERHGVSQSGEINVSVWWFPSCGACRHSSTVPAER